MNPRNPDAGAPVHGRRTALRSAGMGLAALGLLPFLASNADAKKRTKGKKKPVSQEQDRCLPQVAECEAVATTFCAGAADKELCRSTLSTCCQPLGTCNGGQSIQCVINAFTQKVEI